MDDSITQRLRELLQITMMLCDSIDELLGGLSKQLNLVSEGTANATSAVRRRGSR